MPLDRRATLMTPTRRLRRLGRRGAPARGFIMGYILFALVVLGIVVAALGRMNESQTEAKWVEDALVRLKDNVQSIRVQIMTCSALISADEVATGIMFPPQPTGSGNNTLDNVACPMGTEPAMELFDGSSGIFLPRPPSGFDPYLYVNTFPTAGATEAAEVYVETKVSTPQGRAAVTRLARTYSTDEMSVTTSGSTVTLRYYLAKRAASGG